MDGYRDVGAGIPLRTVRILSIASSATLFSSASPLRARSRRGSIARGSPIVLERPRRVEPDVSVGILRRGDERFDRRTAQADEGAARRPPDIVVCIPERTDERLYRGRLPGIPEDAGRDDPGIGVRVGEHRRERFYRSRTELCYGSRRLVPEVVACVAERPDERFYRCRIADLAKYGGGIHPPEVLPGLELPGPAAGPDHGHRALLVFPGRFRALDELDQRPDRRGAEQGKRVRCRLPHRRQRIAERPDEGGDRFGTGEIPERQGGPLAGQAVIAPERIDQAGNILLRPQNLDRRAPLFYGHALFRQFLRLRIRRMMVARYKNLVRFRGTVKMEGYQRGAGGTGVAIPRRSRNRASPSSAALRTAGSLSVSDRVRIPSARGSAISPRMMAA